MVELLSADAAEAAWNYCAPVVDYDEVRPEVSNIFADKAAEVQSLVAKLQKTQRAAEQALDKFVSFARVVLVCRVNHAPRGALPKMKSCHGAPSAAAAAASAFFQNKGGVHAACYGMIARMNLIVFLASFCGSVCPKF